MNAGRLQAGIANNCRNKLYEAICMFAGGYGTAISGILLSGSLTLCEFLSCPAAPEVPDCE
jgi:hypothetical protein